jgi:lysophospholipase L1-like esterase
MANKKITQLASKTSVLSTDLFPIGDATTGMHYDNTHLNGYGYNIIANRVTLLIKQYGW